MVGRAGDLRTMPARLPFRDFATFFERLHAMSKLHKPISIRYVTAALLGGTLVLLGCGQRPAAPIVETVQVQEKADPNPVQAEAAPDYLAEGRVSLQSGDVDKAIEDFTKAIKAEPNDAPRYVYRSGAYTRKGQITLALNDLKEATRLNPRDPEPFSQRGSILGQLGMYSQAMADLTEALRLSPEGPTAVGVLINRGFAYTQLRQPEKALADYNEALRINPKSALAYEYRAGVYFQQSKLKDALADFDQAVAIQPGLAELRLNRGLVYQNMGRHDKAMEDFNEAIRLNPSYIDAYLDRGRACRARGLPILGASLAALISSPEEGPYLAASALVSERVKNGPLAQAEADFKKARELQRAPRQPR